MAAPSSKNASNPVKTALAVACGSAAVIIGIALVAHYAIGAYGGRSLKGDSSMSDAAVAKRMQPVGELVVVDANAPKLSMTGEQVYTTVCAACHAAGVLNAPKFGDKAAWAPVIAAGYENLVKNAITGIRSMPPKGGNPDLSEVEVARAVAHLANAAGANFKAPEPTTTAAPPAAATAPAPASTAAVASGTASTAAASATTAPVNAPAPTGATAAAPVTAPPPTPAPIVAAAPAKNDPANGKSVYETTCTVCHGSGVAGAPKFGDKAAWSPRIAQGVATLHEHAIKGFQGKTGVMPPKGGNLALADADVIAAVDYMVLQVK